MLITCVKCGQEYSSESPSCPACGASHDITCHECGKQYTSTSPACPYCGANNLVIAARTSLTSAVAPANVHVVGEEWSLLRWLPGHRGLLATIGAALMTISLFLPAGYTISVLGRSSSSIINYSSTPTVVFAVLIAAVLALSCTKRDSFQFIPAAACFGIVGRDVYHWHYITASLRQLQEGTTNAELGLRLIAYDFALQWGWYVLVAGGLLVLLASLLQVPNGTRRWHLHFIGWKRFFHDLMG